MDRNGKKPKAARDDAANPERSDTKGHSRDASELARASEGGKAAKRAMPPGGASDKSGRTRRSG